MIHYPCDVFEIYDVFGQDKLMVKHEPLSSSGAVLRATVCFGGAGCL